MSSEWVKCADCGFVALQDEETRQLCEMERQTRENGTRGSGLSGFFRSELGNANFAERHFHPRPICFVGAYNLPAEYGERSKDESEVGKILGVVKELRPCEQFFKWKQGYSPKEHSDMVREEQMMSYQKARDRRDRRFQRLEARVTRAYGRQSLGVAVAAVVAALAGPPLTAWLTPMPPSPIVNVYQQPPSAAPDSPPTPQLKTGPVPSNT